MRGQVLGIPESVVGLRSSPHADARVAFSGEISFGFGHLAVGDLQPQRHHCCVAGGLFERAEIGRVLRHGVELAPLDLAERIGRLPNPLVWPPNHRFSVCRYPRVSGTGDVLF